MAFQLAEAYVQLSQRGIGGVSGAIDGIKRRLMGLINPANLVATALAAIGTGLGAGKLLSLYATQEEAEQRLAAALILVGDASEEALEDQKAFASEMQRLTKLGDEQVLQLQALGASLGKLSGQQLKDATQAAIGLSAALGVDATAAMRLVSRAAVGDTAALSRYGIKLDETLSPQERFNELLRMGAERFSIAEAQANTFGGAVQQMRNAVGDTLEKIGQVFVEVFDLTGIAKAVTDFAQNSEWAISEIKVALGAVWDIAKVVAGAFYDLGSIEFGGLLSAVVDVVQSVRDWIVANREIVQGIIKWAAVIAGVVVAVVAAKAAIIAVGAVISALTGPIGLVAAALVGLGALFPEVFDNILGDLTYFVQNWDIFWNLAVEHTKLAVSNAWERVKTFFLNAYEIGYWFGENWRDVFTDIGNFTVSLFRGIGDNIMAIWNAVREFFRTGRFEVDWSDLTPGFKSQISKLPELTKAAVQESNGAIDKLYEELGQREQDRIAAAQRAGQTGDGPEDDGQSPSLPGTGPGPGGGKRGKFGFTGLAQLAEQMQMKAAERNEQHKQVEAAQRAAGEMENMNRLAQGEGLRVRVMGGDNGQAVPAWV